MNSNTPEKKRCFGNKPGHELYAEYHDFEWGVPVRDDIKLFEMLTLEGAQAGLSFETILKKRVGYRKAFKNFDVLKVSKMSDEELELLRQDSSIVRNKLKIYSVRKNAIIFIKIQKQFGSFANYLWGFVDNRQIINSWNSIAEVPTSTSLSDKISKDLKKRGMSFVGTTIVYAYMQAVGLVNDHFKGCWCYNKNHDSLK